MAVVVELSTGTFARWSRLSLKALRLYDQNGLLKPARVDADTTRERVSSFNTSAPSSSEHRPPSRTSAFGSATSPSNTSSPSSGTFFVRPHKARVGFPQVIAVFDGLSQSLDSFGLEPAGPPREVYFSDFRAARPTDEVCDVAIPVR